VDPKKTSLMRKVIFLFAIILMAATACRSSRTAPQTAQPVDEPTVQAEQTIAEAPVQTPAQAPAVDWYRPDTWLIGYFQHDQLLKAPHDAWYIKEYNNYKPEIETIFKIQDTNVNGVTVLIVLGTWCGDSRREVPRFLKMLDQCGLTRIRVTFLGVDLNKFGPVGDYDKLDIVKVPTFIVYRNYIEAGRIIEYPVTSLEGDFLEILRKEIK
jgi:hypothetical protein